MYLDQIISTNSPFNQFYQAAYLNKDNILPNQVDPNAQAALNIQLANLTTDDQFWFSTNKSQNRNDLYLETNQFAASTDLSSFLSTYTFDSIFTHEQYDYKGEPNIAFLDIDPPPTTYTVISPNKLTLSFLTRATKLHSLIPPITNISFNALYSLQHIAVTIAVTIQDTSLHHTRASEPPILTNLQYKLKLNQINSTLIKNPSPYSQAQLILNIEL